jgi:hypothetical protein
VEARVMIEEKELPELTFFTQFPKEHLRTPGVASALQNIETAFRMAGLYRWPSAMSLMWQSCELLLRVNLGIDLYDKEFAAYEMQDQFNRDKSLTKGLQDESIRFRKLRNDILHHGYSPRDDEKCIEIYFGAGFAYLNRLVKELVGQDMIEIGRKEKANSWFWDLFEDTRKVIKKKVTKKVSLYPGLVPFVFAIRNINRTGGIVNRWIHPNDNNTLVWEQMFQDLEYDVRVRLGETIEKEIEEFGTDFSVFLPLFECFGRCEKVTESIIARIDVEPRDDGDYDLLQVCAIGCVDCQYVLSDPDTLKVFVFDRLSEKQKQLIGCSDYYPASDDYYQGLLISEKSQPKSWALYEEIQKEKGYERKKMWE